MVLTQLPAHPTRMAYPPGFTSADNHLGRGLRALEGGLSGSPLGSTPGVMARIFGVLPVSMLEVRPSKDHFLNLRIHIVGNIL